MNIWKTAKSRCQDKYEHLCEQYEWHGETEQDAKEMADERMDTCIKQKLPGTSIVRYLQTTFYL